MSKSNIFLLSGLLLALFLYKVPDEMDVMALPLLMFIPLLFLLKSKNRKVGVSQNTSRVESVVAPEKREALARIPRSNQKRRSNLISDGAGRLKSIRTMAELVRKPSLRARIVELCDFADVVIDTISYMPEDTPAAEEFVTNNLERFRDSVERTFQEYRKGEYKVSSSLKDNDYDVECFSAFLTVFSKQQKSILNEGTSACSGSGAVL